MKKLYFFSVLFFFFSSCATFKEGEVYQKFNEDQVEVGILELEDLSVEVSYVGAIGHSYIFECYVQNTGEEAFLLDKTLCYLEMEGGQKIQTIDNNKVIASLEKTRKRLKKQRNTSAVIGGILIGVSVFAGIGSGENAGETLLYNADPLVGILDESRWYQSNIRSVKDEIQYIREGQFDYNTLQPGEDIVRDILFPTVKIESDVDLVIEIKGEEYVITFPRDIFR